MTFDWTVFIRAIAIGAIAEIVVLNYPDPYRRAVSVGKVIAIATGVAFLPNPLAQIALAGLLVARVGDVVGELIHRAIVSIVIKREYKEWDTHRNRMDAARERRTSITSET